MYALISHYILKVGRIIIHIRNPDLFKEGGKKYKSYLIIERTNTGWLLEPESVESSKLLLYRRFDKGRGSRYTRMKS